MKASAGKRVLMLLANGAYPHDPRVRAEARTLASEGFQVSIICPALPGQPRSEVLSGVRVHRFHPMKSRGGALSYLREYGNATLACLVGAARVYWHHGFDVVHTHNPPDTLVLVAGLCKLLGKRFVFDHHDLAPEMYRARFGRSASQRVYWVLTFFEKLSCRLADRIICVNESYKRVVIERGGVPAERVHVVRNGPEPDRFPPLDTAPEKPNGQITIAYAGVMGPQDGVDYLLRALRHLRHDLGRTDFHCLLLGSGDALPELRRLTADLALDEHVSFTGWLVDPEFSRRLAAADICVDPSPRNPYTAQSTMIKIMEYMALGKPVVAFDLPEHRVSAGAAAVYVEPDDESEFAGALATLMDDEPRRCRMGQVGRHRIEAKLAWPHQARRLLDAYGFLSSTRVDDVDAARDAAGPQ